MEMTTAAYRIPQLKTKDLEARCQHHPASTHTMKKDQKLKRLSLALREWWVINLKGSQDCGP